MIIIAHRGNLHGPDEETENTKRQIQLAIEEGFDVEIDVRYNKDNFLWLGHDAPKETVNVSWLTQREKNLWVHCKDRDSLRVCLGAGLNCFYHERDPMVLTSNGYIWHYMCTRTAGQRSVLVMPERCYDKREADEKEVVRSINMFKESEDFGFICTDYPFIAKEVIG